MAVGTDERHVGSTNGDSLGDGAEGIANRLWRSGRIGPVPASSVGAGQLLRRDVQASPMLPTVVVFCLGVCNFAAHRAVLESGHPVLTHVPWLAHPVAGRLSLLLEFAVLVAALVMASGGSAGWIWIYLVYTATNLIGAWLIAGGRI